jgi:hypothetical protein
MTKGTYYKLYREKTLEARFRARWGYRVTYPCGFRLWESPEVFNKTYQKVTDLEKALFEKIKGQSEVK